MSSYFNPTEVTPPSAPVGARLLRSLVVRTVGETLELEPGVLLPLGKFLKFPVVLV